MSIITSFQDILDEALRLSSCEEGGILIRNNETGELRVEAFIGKDVEFKERVLPSVPDSSVCASSAYQMEIIYIPDVSSDMRFRSLSETHIKSELVCPIVYRDVCEGVINLESPQANAFSDATIQELEKYVSSIAFKFYAEKIIRQKYFLEKQVVSLREITELILNNISNSQTILDKILHFSLILTEADTGGILLLSNDKENLELNVHRGLKEQFDNASLARGEGLCWKCVSERKPIYVGNIKGYEGSYACLSAPDINSELVVPLKSSGEVFGVINIESTGYSAFSFEHKQTLHLFAQQVSLLFQMLNMKKKWQGAWSMARWGDLSNNMEHRMNNLIGPLPTLISRIEKKLNNSDLIKYTSHIRQNAEEALKIIKENKEIFSSEDTYLDVRNIVELLATQMLESKDKVTWRLELPADNIIIYAPELLIKELFREMIGNALKAINEVGSINITLKKSWDVLIFEIRDSGPGFDLSSSDALFKRGVQGHKDRQGTGYGLWWTQQFINALGGEITLNNVVDGGGYVRITIPLNKLDTKEEVK